MPEDANQKHPDVPGNTNELQTDGHAHDGRGSLSSDPMVSFAVTVVVTVAIIGAAVALIFNTFVTTRPIPAPASPEAMKQHGVSQSTSKVTFNPPPIDDAPANMRDAVRRGHRILMDTRGTLPEYTGNKLNCKNCHFQAGTIRKTLSLVGVAAVYPQYNRSEGYSIDLVERTNLCLTRNLNGKPLPPDGKEMQAVMAYYHWISKGVPVYAEVPWLGLEAIQSEHKPDVSHGKTLFGSKCSSCHGQNGQGHLPDDGPPLWGDDGFTASSDMAHTNTLAAFVHRFMPKGNADLTTVQALDVAAFVLSHPRAQMKSTDSHGKNVGDK